LAAGSAVGFTAVFVMSIRRGQGGWSPIDRAALVVAAAGVALSFATGNPLVALVAVVVAEAAAVALTAGKALRDPESETLSTWVLDGAAGAAAVLAVPGVALGALLYPVHHLCANSAVAACIIAGRRARARRLDPSPGQDLPFRAPLAFGDGPRTAVLHRRRVGGAGVHRDPGGDQPGH
jgi:hypothetical protein